MLPSNPLPPKVFAVPSNRGLSELCFLILLSWGWLPGVVFLHVLSLLKPNLEAAMCFLPLICSATPTKLPVADMGSDHH